LLPWSVPVCWRLAQALHGTLKIEDLIDPDTMVAVEDMTKEEISQ